MNRMKKKMTIIEQVAITGIAAEGNAIAKMDDLVIFVPYVVPGDIVDLQILKRRSHYATAKAIRFHHYSPLHIMPFCEHYGICGGCQWQILPYPEQLRYKQQQVMDNLTRIGKMPLPDCQPILGSENTCFYRNKLEFTFSNNRWLTPEELASDETFSDRDALGFHIPGMFDKVLDIRKCWLQDDISNQIRLEIKRFCKTNDYTFFDLRKQTGMMRNIIIRTTTTGEVMLIVVFYEIEEVQRQRLLRHLADTFPAITSLLFIVNRKANDTITDQQVSVFKGNEYIIEQMGDFRFKIGPKSFFQTNSIQAHQLYRVVRDFAELTGQELVYDLYTGTGTIANYIARHARQVIGIEYVPEAIADAEINASLNKIENTLFFTGDMKSILNEDFIRLHGAPDVIITDPPRAGMHDQVIKTILSMAADRIVYVSCNPATQARDLNLLAGDYTVEKIQPVDMFPHTHHVENVVALRRTATQGVALY
ncbi:MAG: 23S rRNA (uracil(1939)-C(5))-methyltransferase RlmD [Dysgonamonadaceae bacterium]|nr:23S rRNA (uracil(1939)-C(5))-methyltransferase RlmD [Dysgonamonadaceae bacterium]